MWRNSTFFKRAAAYNSLIRCMEDLMLIKGTYAEIPPSSYVVQGSTGSRIFDAVGKYSRSPDWREARKCGVIKRMQQQVARHLSSCYAYDGILTPARPVQAARLLKNEAHLHLTCPHR